jgi:hypothetical protein
MMTNSGGELTVRYHIPLDTQGNQKVFGRAKENLAKIAAR